MKRLIAVVIVLALAACEPGPVAIPPGAQQVAVNVSAGGIRLNPQTVRPGDVYVVLNLGTAGSIVFVRSSSGGVTNAGGQPQGGGLTDDQLTQLAQSGDAGQGVSYEVLSVNCCGNVVKEPLTPGKYAFTVPGSVAVLQVSP